MFMVMNLSQLYKEYVEHTVKIAYCPASTKLVNHEFWRPSL